MGKTTKDIVNFYNNVSREMEFFEEIGFEIIDFGEDYIKADEDLEYARAILRKTDNGKVYGIDRWRDKRGLSDIQESHVYQMVEKEITKTIYVRKTK